MSNIYKPIYRWKALDERNPMVYDILGIDKVTRYLTFTKITKMNTTLCKLHLFLILNNHMVAYGARDHIHIHIVTQKSQEKN